MPTPQAIKEPRESSAKTSLADGEAEIQQQTDRQTAGMGAAQHTQQSKETALHKQVTVNSMEHADFNECTEIPVPYKQNPLLNQKISTTDNKNRKLKSRHANTLQLKLD